MTEVPVVPAEKLEPLGRIPTQTLIDALWVKQWPQAMIHGARPLFPGPEDGGPRGHPPLRAPPAGRGGRQAQGRGRRRSTSPSSCAARDEVLVASSVGPWESIGGDIKFFRLFQRRIAGLVTDGSVRDSESLRAYGFPVYCHSTTAKQGPAVHWPWGVNEVIACGGIAVRPGDAIVGDDDGVVVVPAPLVDEVIKVAGEREAVEHVIKKELERHPGSPGRYYPFNDATWQLYEEYKRRGEA